MSPLLRNARLYGPPEYEIKLLELEKHQREVAQLREKVGLAAETKQPWYKSSPHTLRRRHIVLKNPGLSAKAFCKVFDSNGIPLPTTWEEEFGETSWAAAYKIKKARGRIQKIISTDKKAG